MLILFYYLTRKSDNPPVQVVMDELKLALYCQVQPQLGLSFSSSSWGLLVRKKGEKDKCLPGRPRRQWRILCSLPAYRLWYGAGRSALRWGGWTQPRQAWKHLQKTLDSQAQVIQSGNSALPCPCTAPASRGCCINTAAKCCFQIEVCSSSSWPEKSWPSILHVCSEPQIRWLTSPLGWSGI